MRGKDLRNLVKMSFIRITPAHAGKREDRMRSSRDNGDHPRTCGEKLLFANHRCTVIGSPPHMRGKEFVRRVFPLSDRITPAHAGKRRILTLFTRGRWDHPRTCGEKVHSAFLHSILLGSPPHMRGKDYAKVGNGYVAGITPAHAGKSVFRRGLGELFGDHPRTCGEKTKKIP